MIRPGLLAAAAALFAAGPAGAQQYRDADVPSPLMREGEPEVLAPPPRPVPQGVVAASNFRAAYTRAKQPKMMVFWNKSFTDEVASNYRNTGRVDVDSAYVRGPGYGASSTTMEYNTGRARERDASTRQLAEVDDFAVEAAFTQALTANGAVLIDRSIAMRTSRSARGVGREPNVQEIEAAAATARADLLVEINQTPANTPSGAAFRVTVKDLRRARVLVNVLSRGVPPLGRAPLVAGPGGFVRAAPPPITPEGVGRQVASETMAALAGALR